MPCSIKNPLLAVIVPVYNTEQFLPECLNSLFDQSYKNIFVILVDDCSQGNVKEIFAKYHSVYPNMMLVSHETNKGLFRARMSGIEASKQINCDYIIFLDSDDSVSVGIYEHLIDKAIASEADIVLGENIEVCSDGTKRKMTSTLFCYDYCLDNNQLLDCLFKQNGYDYTWWLVWNKLLKADLVYKAYDELSHINDHIVMLEDVLFTTAFYLHCNKFVNIHDDYIYYRVNKDSSSKDLQTNIEKTFTSVLDVKKVFEYVCELLAKHNHANDYDENIKIWRNSLFKNYLSLIETSGLSKTDKKVFAKRMEPLLDKSFSNVETFFPFHSVSSLADYNNSTKKEVLSEKTKIVSFDIFDTLVTRPFINPTDLFDLMSCIIENKYFKNSNIIDFRTFRETAERNARDKKRVSSPQYEDITLDEIYIELKEIYPAIENHINEIKELEKSLEISLCKKREYTNSILDLARKHGKKIVAISDMYLPKDVVEAILAKNNIVIDELYLSSDVGLCKATSNLFKYVKNKENVNYSDIVHIGDNNLSDFYIPNKLGIRCCRIPRTLDVFCGIDPEIFGGLNFQKTFQKNTALVGTKDSLCTIYLKTMIGVVANKMFDNPFKVFDKSSDFNRNPFFIGYYLLGMDLFGVTRWLYDSCKKEKTDNLHFIARDGYLVKKSFDIFTECFQDEHLNVFYSYFNRKTIFPIQMFQQSNIYSFQNDCNILTQSPKSVINMLQPIIEKEKWDKRVELCENNGFHFETKFSSQVVFAKFGKFFIDNFYSQNKTNSYIETFKNHFADQFNGINATFDVGYSSRVESALNNACNFKIKAHYLNTNGDRSNRRAVSCDLEVDTYYDFRPAICGGIREVLFSEPNHSCVGFDDKFNPVFKQEFFTQVSREIINIIQSGALSFVKDYLDIFKDYLPLLSARKSETSLPLNAFLVAPTDFDLLMFNVFLHEDDMGQGKIKMVNEWKNMISECNVGIPSQNTTKIEPFDVGIKFSNYKPPLRWFIMMSTLELGDLKGRIKKRLKKCHVIYFITKYTYKFFRGIYHLIFRRNKKSRGNVYLQ